MKYFLQMSLVLIILWSNSAQAQQIHTHSLTKAWEQATATFPGLQERKHLIEAFRIRKKEVQSQALPQIQLQTQSSFGTLNGSAGAFFPVPGVFNVSGNNADANANPKNVHNAFGLVVVDWRIFEFGRQRSAVDAAQYQVHAAESNYDATSLSLQSSVTRLYIDMLYNKANLQWAETNALRVSSIKAVTTSLAQAGIKPGADTSLAASSFLQATAIQHEWLGKLNSSKINFTEVVPVQNFDLAESQYMESDAAHTMIDAVPVSHPYLKGLADQVSYEQTQEMLITKGAFPSLSVLGGLSTRGNNINPDGSMTPGLTSAFSNYANNYLIGLGLSWNLSGIYTSSLGKKRVKENLKSVHAKYDAQRLKIETALSSVNARIHQQRIQLGENRMAVQEARMAYDLYLVVVTHFKHHPIAIWDFCSAGE